MSQPPPSPALPQPLAELARPALDWLSGQSDALLARLLEWAAIGSGSHHPEGLQCMQEALLAAAADLPARVECLPLGPRPDLDGDEQALGSIVVLRCRPEAPCRVLLSGHYDTVYGPDHPFQKTQWVNGRTLRGPGVVDMKGGLVILLAALQALERTSVASRLGWEVWLVPDEEIGSPGSGPHLREAAARHHLGLVFEPALSDGGIIRARKGGGTFRALVQGRAAHAGRDFAAGRNAIAALARFLLQVESLNGQIEGAIFNTGFIEGGGPVNIVPDRASARFNIRVQRVDDIPLVRSRIAELVAEANRETGIHLEWKGGFSRPPFEVTPERTALFQAYQETARMRGLDLAWGDSGGGSDANLLAASSLPCLDGLGARGGHLHSEREFLLVDSLAERAALNALFLVRLAAGEIPVPEV